MIKSHLNKRNLVLGAKGLVGSHVVSKLRQKGYEDVLEADRKTVDLSSQKATNMFFYQRSMVKQIHTVYLCAAKVGGIVANNENPVDFIMTNLKIQTNVLENCFNYGVEKVVFLGSSCIYPKFAKQPMKESYLMTGELEPTNSAYAVAKIAGIEMCKSYNRQFGTNYIAAMPTNLYGECFSEDTEVLTCNGIVNIKDIQIGDEVYTLNPDTKNIEIGKVIQKQKKETNEFFIFNEGNVDFKVTNKHKIYYSTTTKFQKKSAEYFRKRAGKKFGQIRFANHKKLINIKHNNELITLESYIDKNHIKNNNMVKDFKHSHSKFYPIEFNAKDFCEFLGWYISEGSIITSQKSKGGTNSIKDISIGQIRISQSKNKNNIKYTHILNLIKKMNIPFGSDDYSIYFSSRLFRNYIEKNIGIGSKNKKIPDFIFDKDCPTIWREILFESLMQGDGNKTGHRYTTISTILAEQFVHLAFLLGKNVTSVKKENNVYRIHMKVTSNYNTIKYKNIKIDSLQKKEISYCITVDKNHIIYAGRNKKLNWIGQCDNFDLNTSHVIPALIRKFHEAKENNTDVVLWGNGRAMREFLYVEDLADALVFLAENYNATQEDCLINVGFGEDISIVDLAEMIKWDVVGFEGRIVWDTSKPNGTPRKLLDTSKINKLGWVPKVGLLKGLQETYEWYTKNR